MDNRDKTATAPSVNAPPRRGWRTYAHRWLMVYSIALTLSVTLLISAIGWSLTESMLRNTDSVMHWQLAYFAFVPDARLPDAIAQRIAFEHTHPNHYGLFDSGGRRIAGDILTLPRLSDPLEPDVGVTVRGQIRVVSGATPPLSRIMMQSRATGLKLVIARRLSPMQAVQETLIIAGISIGAICIALSFGTAWLLNIRQKQRAREIRQITLRIARGELQLRLPNRGRDELDMLAYFINHMLDEVELLVGDVKSACDGVAHDLRMPLNRISCLLDGLSEDLLRGETQRIAQVISRASEQTRALSQHFHAMLRIAEVSALERRRGFESIDLAELVEEVGSVYQPVAEDRGIEWHLEILASHPIIRGDRALLFEAFSNLLDNAIKFSKLQGHVCIRLINTPLGPQFTVRDDGPGIAADERELILTRFYRGKNTSGIRGSGLGLSIVSAILRVHNFALVIEDATPGTVMQIQCWSDVELGLSVEVLA